jgi:plasmid stabilization system protein ParE
MPATHRVILTDESLANLESIAHHIRQSSPQNAGLVAARILDAVD